MWTEFSWIWICSSRGLLVRIRALLLQYGNVALSSDLYEPQLGRLCAALRHTNLNIRRPQPQNVAGGVFINFSTLSCNKLVLCKLIQLHFRLAIPLVAQSSCFLLSLQSEMSYIYLASQAAIRLSFRHESSAASSFPLAKSQYHRRTDFDYIYIYISEMSYIACKSNGQT